MHACAAAGRLVLARTCDQHLISHCQIARCDQPHHVEPVAAPTRIITAPTRIITAPTPIITARTPIITATALHLATRISTASALHLAVGLEVMVGHL